MTNQDLCNMVNELMESDEGMNLWEQEFIEDMQRRNQEFTTKQRTKIEQIWNKVFG